MSGGTPWTAETVTKAIRPTLDAFVEAAEPTCRKVADTIYEQLLEGVQDYLRENGEWNIGEDIRRCRLTEAENRALRVERAELIHALRRSLKWLTVCDDRRSDETLRFVEALLTKIGATQ